MVTEEQVYDALKEVFDPEIPVNIVELGLIYGVKIDDDQVVRITMTLTTPGCGMSHQIAVQTKAAAAGIEGVKDAFVTVVWEPPWDSSKMSDSAKKKLGIG